MPSIKHTLAGSLARLALSTERLLRTGSALPPQEARTILVLEYMLPLGACVHLTPVFEALKRSRPTLTVIVATRALGRDVLRHSPFVDHLLETPDPLTDLRAAAASLAAQLRALSLTPDCCLTGASDQRTRIALLGALVCRGWRGGFTVLPSLYQHPLTVDPSLSLIGNNLRLAQLLGCDAPPLEPRVFYTAADSEAARGLIAPLRARGKPVLIVVSQNSGGQQTGWHTDRFTDSIRHASQILDYSVVYVGTQRDQPAIEQLRAETGGLSVAGRTTVNQLAALLALSDLVLTLDTGTMHVGRAVGVPMVVLGPSWQKPLEWLPLGKPQVRILRGQDRPDVPPNYRLDEISASAVIAALDDLAHAFPANDASRQARVQAGLSSVDLCRP